MQTREIMGGKEKNLNPMDYLVTDLLEEILLGLPLKSVFRFKTVSKQWRSILESRRFVDMRLKKVEKKLKILAVGEGQTKSGFEGDEEIEMIYLHCDDATEPSLTFDGLVCIPKPGWINVLNPSTRQLRRFPCSPDHPVSPFCLNRQLRDWPYLTFFPGNWAMGFGRDKVNGCYKVVRMCFDPVEECEVLDLETGEWRKLIPPGPPFHDMDVGRKSACVNGSIYWLKLLWDFKLLALNLHTLEFRNVSVPHKWFSLDTQIMNLEDRLAIAKTKGGPEWELEILSLMDSEEELWTKTYSITLASIIIGLPWEHSWFTVVTVSKLGNLVLYDKHKRLFKYNTKTNEICCLSSNISVISLCLENLAPLRSDSGHHPEDYKIRISSCGLCLKHPEAGISTLAVDR
ncbi:unnamed protein product [Arabidopsis halleri]